MQPIQQEQQKGEGQRGNVPIQQYANAVLSERTDSLVYGFLRRTGYNKAADCMEQESPFLSGSLGHSRGDSRTVITINDRVHDHTLEQIIQLFCQDGRFGVNQNLLDFGEELRQLTNRYTTITSSVAPGRSTVHQQLYGRPAYSRQTQQQQNYTLRMAPQARTKMELNNICHVGEARYREEQQQAHFKQMQVRVEEHHRIQQQQQQQTLKLMPVSSEGLPPPSDRQLPAHTYEEGEIVNSSQSGISEGSSRRKLHQPQNFEAVTRETLIDPLVGIINEKPWNEIENIQIDDNDQFFQGLNVIDEEFLAMYDYKQPSNDCEPDFEEMMAPNFENGDPSQNLHYDPASLPVGDEIVLETSVEPKQSYHFPNPSPLLSPLPKHMSFQKKMEESPKIHPQENTSKVVENPKVPKKPDPLKKREQFNGAKDKNSTSDRERKERRSVERSSRTGSPRRPPEEPKRKFDEKKKQKEKEREREKSTNRDEAKDVHDSAPAKRQSSKHKLQSDRESTSSSSSRAPPVSSDTSESSLKKEDKRREKDDKRKADKEKERQKQSLPPMSLNVDSKVGGDMLNKVRKSHAAASSTDSKEDNSTREPSKRKADEMIKNRKDFKIPKKGSATLKPDIKVAYGAHLQSGPLIRESVPPTPASSKREKESSSKKPELCEGEDRPDATHFIKPRYHIARLSSMFVNIDKGYEAFQQGLNRNKKDSKVVNEDALSDVSISPPPPASLPSSSSRHSTANDNNVAGPSQVSTRPNKPMIAPQKGYLLNKSPSKTPSTEDSSAEDSDKDSQDDDDPFPQKKLLRRASRSPEPKKMCREIDMDKAAAMLNRIHGPGK